MILLGDVLHLNLPRADIAELLEGCEDRVEVPGRDAHDELALIASRQVAALLEGRGEQTVEGRGGLPMVDGQPELRGVDEARALLGGDGHHGRLIGVEDGAIRGLCGVAYGLRREGRRHGLRELGLVAGVGGGLLHGRHRHAPAASG